MALSNLAWVLASNGYDVLLIDWDLEAPGLHRYLRPFLVDPELTATPGLIDYVWDAARVSMTPPDSKEKRPVRFPTLEDYVVGLDWDFRGIGSIAFLPAGRQDANYAHRVNTFDWDAFYERLGGGKLLQTEREALRANYDFILIDSRTGVSDTSGICTVQMPDQLVVLFTLNRQSIRGAAAVAESIRAQRGDSLPIYPVPTRVENAETDKVALALAYAQNRFASILPHLPGRIGESKWRVQERYWSEVQTAYRTFYAFEEVPAAFKDTPGGRGTVLDATEQLAGWLTDQRVTALQVDDDAKRRNDVVEAYTLGKGDTDQPPALEQPAPRGGLPAWAVVFIRRQLWPRRWQLSGAAVLALAAIIAVVQWRAAETEVAANAANVLRLCIALRGANVPKPDVNDQLLKTLGGAESACQPASPPTGGKTPAKS